MMNLTKNREIMMTPKSILDDSLQNILSILKKNENMLAKMKGNGLSFPSVEEFKKNLFEKNSDISIIEIVFVDYITQSNHLNDIVMEELINNNFWDVSKEDCYGRSAIDYMNKILSLIPSENKESYNIEFSKVIRLSNGEKLINPESFIVKTLDIELMDPHLFIYIWSNVFKKNSSISLLDYPDAKEILIRENFAKKMSDILKEKIEKSYYGFSPLIKIFSSYVKNPCCKALFKNEKDYYSIFESISFCCNKTKDHYTDFIYLYNNKEYIKDPSNYSFLFPRIINLLREYKFILEPHPIKSIDIYNDLMGLFSYNYIIDNEYFREELEYFVIHNKLSEKEIKDNFYEEMAKYEKIKIENSQDLSVHLEDKKNKKRL